MSIQQICKLTSSTPVCPLLQDSLCSLGAWGFYTSRHHRLPHASIVASLLLLASVQLNPRPATHVVSNGNFGSFNIHSTINKSALIHSIIADHSLDILDLDYTQCSAQDQGEYSTSWVLCSPCSSQDSTWWTKAQWWTRDHPSGQPNCTKLLSALSPCIRAATHKCTKRQQSSLLDYANLLYTAMSSAK